MWASEVKTLDERSRVVRVGVLRSLSMVSAPRLLEARESVVNDPKLAVS